MNYVVAFPLAVLRCYLLWIKGYFVVQSKTAVAYIGRKGAAKRGASVTACSGYTKAVLPLKRGQTYNFRFDCNVTEGEIIAEIWENRQLVLTLGENCKKAKITAAKGRYIIKTIFMRASGDYEVKWN